MSTIKNLIELKRNVLEFEKWFVDNPTEIPTFKVFYEKLGVNRKFIRDLKKKLETLYDKSIDNMSIDKSMVKSIDKTIDNTIDNTIDKSIDNITIDKSIDLMPLGINSKVIDKSLKEYKEMYDILHSCYEKMQNEFWHRALNSERKYLNPRLIEMYYTNFIEKKEKSDDTININIKLDKTEVSIKNNK